MSVIERLFTLLGKAMLYVATAALLLLTFLVVLSSVMRYVYGQPFSFTEEFVALLYMASVFLAVPLATSQRAHVSIAVLPQRLMQLWRRPFHALSCIIMISFCVWFAVVSYDFMAQSYKFGSKSEQAEFVLWPWMAIMPAMMLLVALVSVLHLIQGVDKAESEPASEVSLKGDAL